jgi:hypothetical protein
LIANSSFVYVEPLKVPDGSKKIWSPVTGLVALTSFVPVNGLVVSARATRAAAFVVAFHSPPAMPTFSS